MTTKIYRYRRAGSSGFTLAEALMAVVTLSIAAAGVLLPFSSGAVVRAEGTRSTLGAALASDLMEEIVCTPFEQIVDSYDGYSEPQGQITDTTGAVFSGSNYANFSREASCQYVYVAQETGTTQAAFILTTVRVNYSGRPIAIINRLIAK